MPLHSLPRSLIGPRAQNLALRFTASFALLLLTFLGAIYGLSEYQLRRTYDVDLMPLRSGVQVGSLAEGERLSHIFGCSGCHGEHGNVLADIPNVVRLVAPNLTRIVPNYSDTEFIRLVRSGIKRDGTSTIIMPSREYAGMSDDDLATLLRYLRSRSIARDQVTGPTSFHFLGRIALVAGKVPFGAKLAIPALAPLHRPVSSPNEEGSYLVGSICSHCHNVTEQHDDGWGMITPPLALMGQAYSDEEFRHLMRSGKAIGDREVGLMSEVARSDLSHFTDPEIDAIHAYLKSVEMPEE